MKSSFVLILVFFHLMTFSNEVKWSAGFETNGDIELIGVEDNKILCLAENEGVFDCIVLNATDLTILKQKELLELDEEVFQCKKAFVQEGILKIIFEERNNDGVFVSIRFFDTETMEIVDDRRVFTYYLKTAEKKDKIAVMTARMMNTYLRRLLFNPSQQKSIMFHSEKNDVSTDNRYNLQYPAENKLTVFDDLLEEVKVIKIDNPENKNLLGSVFSNEGLVYMLYGRFDTQLNPEGDAVARSIYTDTELYVIDTKTGKQKTLQFDAHDNTNSCQLFSLDNDAFLMLSYCPVIKEEGGMGQIFIYYYDPTTNKMIDAKIVLDDSFHAKLKSSEDQLNSEFSVKSKFGFVRTLLFSNPRSLEDGSIILNVVNWKSTNSTAAVIKLTPKMELDWASVSLMRDQTKVVSLRGFVDYTDQTGTHYILRNIGKAKKSAQILVQKIRTNGEMTFERLSFDTKSEPFFIPSEHIGDEEGNLYIIGDSKHGSHVGRFIEK